MKYRLATAKDGFQEIPMALGAPSLKCTHPHSEHFGPVRAYVKSGQPYWAGEAFCFDPNKKPIQ